MTLFQLDEALKKYISDPQQDLMAAILSAVSGAPVIPGSFPPPPPPLPPLNVHGGDGELDVAQHIEAVDSARQIMAMHVHNPVLTLGGKLQVYRSTVALRAQDGWSDVTQFTNAVDSISTSLKPVLTLGGELQAFLSTVQKQMGMPAELHTRLTQLSELTTFLHDLSQFLQQFPIFKPFLPALTASLAKEQQAITYLDTDVGQLVQSAASLSTSLQVNTLMFY